MDTPYEVRWRLRNGDHIVGFERHMGGRVWSSTDGFWWRGERLTYTDKDRCLMKDVNNQWLFEGDVVTWHQIGTVASGPCVARGPKNRGCSCEIKK